MLVQVGVYNCNVFTQNPVANFNEHLKVAQNKKENPTLWKDLYQKQISNQSGGGGKAPLQVKDTASSLPSLPDLSYASSASSTSNLSYRDAKMKSARNTLTPLLSYKSSKMQSAKSMINALPLLNTLVLLVLFSFTFSSCKDCGKKGTNPAGRGGNTNNADGKAIDSGGGNATNNTDGKAIDSGGGNTTNKTNSTSNPSGNNNASGPSDISQRSNPSNPNKNLNGNVVDSRGVVDISEIEAAKQAACEATGQAAQAAKDANQLKNQIEGQTKHVTGKYSTGSTVMRQAQKDLDRVVESAKTAVEFAENTKTQATKVARDVAKMDATPGINIDPSVKATVGKAAHDADEANKQAQGAAMEACQAVVDTTTAIITGWRTIANYRNNNDFNIAEATTNIVKVGAVQVEWLVKQNNKPAARDVLATMEPDVASVRKFADEHPREPGCGPTRQERWNNEAQAALRKAEELCR
jgi:hypothetical protein